MGESQAESLILRTYDLAREATARGNHPFGALILIGGDVAEEYGNEVVTRSDVTRHAETGLVANACARLGRDALGGATLYTSTEPCLMCCGAIHWAGIPRIVFGVRASKMMEAIGEPYRGFPCREIFDRLNPSVTIEGPMLEDEGFEIHEGFWPEFLSRG